MQEINATEFRRNLPLYLKRVRAGEELLITSRGAVVAHLSPPRGIQESARVALRQLRENARIGDVTAPIDATWDVTDVRT